MDDSAAALSQLAISAALSANWEEATKLNQQIIEGDPKNVEALNRLGRAHFELCDITAAKKFFDLALESDPYNQIAAKFLKRIETFSKKGLKQQTHNGAAPCQMPVSSDLFIEEPGKTKLVNLLKVAEPQKLSLLSSGRMVNLLIKNRGITVTDQYNDYLGVLPDDLSHHLIRLIKGGNKYQALIKTIKPNGVTILIREAYRSVRFKNQPSFLDNLNVNVTYSTGSLIMTDDSDDPVNTEEDESL